ncbi:MAG TPA: hypothetical protein VF212_00855 [Longimicrobiales bacterium]
MILPNVRASFGRAEAGFLLRLTAGDDERARKREEDRLREEGFDAILDDPRTLNALMASGGISGAPAPLVFYLLVRHALLEDGINNHAVADYLAALLLEFGRGQRARRPTEDADAQSYDYLADIVEALDSAQGREAFLLRAHLGNFALWLSGLFPDHITARVERRGAPGLRYYEAMGATGYRLAADTTDAESWGLDRLYQTFADNFPALRIALNRIADRHLFPTRGDAVDRLLRQIADRFHGQVQNRMN